MRDRTSAPRPDYGIDAPSVLAGYAVAGAAFLAAGLWAVLLAPEGGVLPTVLEQGIWGGPLLLAGGGVHLWSSKVGKVREARRIVASIPWRGDERVLDVGCGRGVLLIEAARRLRTGLAVGVDIWRRKDQSGNRPQATLHNAALEGVLNRVEVTDGDARALPFHDGSFDVVLSSGVLHNIHRRDDRRSAVREIVRVLKPAGRVVILDIAATGQYMRTLHSEGMAQLRRGRPRPLWLFPARVVTARKPDIRGSSEDPSAAGMRARSSAPNR